MPLPLPLAEPYLVAAATALALVGRPEVERSWEAPSALAEMSVGGLAAHLTSQVLSTERTLDHQVDADETVSVREHYTKVAWRGAPLNQETNSSIRLSSEEQATAGPAVLVHHADVALSRLAGRLPTMDGSSVVQPPWTTWSLSLEDFLMTRLVELSVHTDDLAVSVGVPTPELPESVRQPVRHLLVDLAAERRGDTAVLSALTRAERAPDSVTAF